jgi:hypothetical protein
MHQEEVTMSEYYDDPGQPEHHEEPYPADHDSAIGDPIGQPIYEPGHETHGYLPDEYQPSHYNETAYEEPTEHAPDYNTPDYHEGQPEYHEEQPPAYASDGGEYHGEGLGHSDGATQYQDQPAGHAPDYSGEGHAPEYNAGQPAAGGDATAGSGGTSTSSLSH